MSNLLMGIIYGILSSFILVPLGIFLFVKLSSTSERRKIKMMLAKKQYLMPIDKKDYDTKIWPDIIPESREQIKQRMGKIFIPKVQPGVVNG